MAHGSDEDRPGTPGPRRGRSLRLAALVVVALLALPLGGCISHYLIHPETSPPGVVEWSEAFTVNDGLGVRLEWARPARAGEEGPLPAVMVHPEAGHPAREMRGVLRSLAQRGYVAVAADYRRDGKGLTPWQHEDDPRVVLERLAARPEVDPDRIGALGFSQGGVYSLLIAAYTGEVAAVVAYYPVTDFELWLEDPERTGPRRWVFRNVIAPYFRRQSGAETDEELKTFLARASAYRQAEDIRAPVLLIHGDRDTSADVKESRRLEARLRELDRTVELVVVEDAGHVFNFRRADLAAQAWAEATAWLDRYVRDRPPD